MNYAIACVTALLGVFVALGWHLAAEPVPAAAPDLRVSVPLEDAAARYQLARFEVAR